MPPPLSDEEIKAYNTSQLDKQLNDIVVKSNHIAKWLEEQPADSHVSLAQNIYGQLHGYAGQPRANSGNFCVKLCSFVEQCSKSHSSQLRSWAFSQDVALKLLNFYLEWNETDNHRSMRLVIDLLPQLLRRNPDEDAKQSIKGIILDNLMSIITGKATKPLAKSAIKTLDHFLIKGVFGLDEIKASYTNLHMIDDSIDDLKIWNSFMTELFGWMKLHLVCPTAARFVMTLYLSLRRQEPEKSIGFEIEVWNKWLSTALEDEPSLLDAIKTYIFLPLFKADKKEALRFLQRMSESEAVSASSTLGLNLPALLQLAALETGKRVGLVEEPALSGDDSVASNGTSVLLHEKILEAVLAHPAHEVRSLALSLLISSPSTTRPYSSTALDLLRKHLSAYFAESDAKFRNDVTAKVRDMFKRVRGAIFVLKKSIPRAAARDKRDATGEKVSAKPILYHTNLISLPEMQLTECLAYHESFLTWYLRFLCGELIPNASYQRHVASLKSVAYILKMEGEASKSWETPDDQHLYFDQFDARWLRVLADLIVDPFDDVRELSAAIIKKIFSDNRYARFYLMATDDKVNADEELGFLLKRADDNAQRSGRADHSDGVARVYQMLYKVSNPEKRMHVVTILVGELEEKLRMAEKDLGKAVMEAPLHGHFAALSYIWQVVTELRFSELHLRDMMQLQDRMISCCQWTWEVVRYILCDDSPEGHLPQELEEVDGLDTKDLLSFSFRAIHESSNLMRTMALTVKRHDQHRECRIIPPLKAFKTIGNLSFEQLSNLRHRGAFTSVAATFATCCQCSQYYAFEEGNSPIVDTWYKNTIQAIYGQRSTTRRSAGIPSMIVGVLNGRGRTGYTRFDVIMDKLMHIAGTKAYVTETDGSNLPQVHAYNCLREIFKSSYLRANGNEAEAYLPQCLELAANGLKSELWAIRNCGLILLRSLIDCLFGTHESKTLTEAGWDGKAIRIPYHRYPTLQKALLNLLKSGHQMMDSMDTDWAAAESVFPALDIIRRAGPPEAVREELQVHISKYLRSPVWHVREIAARTLCSCLLHQDWLGTLSGLAQMVADTPSKVMVNQDHGLLLCYKFIIERRREVMLDQLLADLPRLEHQLRQHWAAIKYYPTPEIAAAYLEVVNQVLELRRTQGQSLPHFEIPVDKASSALLRAQLVIYKVNSASFAENPFSELESLLFDSNLGVDSLVLALEKLPLLWKVDTLKDHQLCGFCDLYMDVCFKICAINPRMVALENLTQVLDRMLQSVEWRGFIPVDGLMQMWKAIRTGPLNPALANAIVRVSGGIMAIGRLTGKSTYKDLNLWAQLNTNSEDLDYDWDARMARAEAMRSFFAVIGTDCTHNDFLMLHSILYNYLNDDDDEIRDVAAAAVSSILNQPLVPIEAANRYIHFMTTTYASNYNYRVLVIANITEDPAFDPKTLKFLIDTALLPQDELFAVERPNLFLDQVREVQRWIVAFDAIHWDLDDQIVRFSIWLMQGLDMMLVGIVDLEDGPLGYASQAAMFTLLSRIVYGAAAMIRKHPDPMMRREMDRRSAPLRERLNHMSDILIQPLTDMPTEFGG